MRIFVYLSSCALPRAKTSTKRQKAHLPLESPRHMSWSEAPLGGSDLFLFSPCQKIIKGSMQGNFKGPWASGTAKESSTNQSPMQGAIDGENQA